MPQEPRLKGKIRDGWCATWARTDEDAEGKASEAGPVWMHGVPERRVAEDWVGVSDGLKSIKRNAFIEKQQMSLSH